MVVLDVDDVEVVVLVVDAVLDVLELLDDVVVVVVVVDQMTSRLVFRSLMAEVIATKILLSPPESCSVSFVPPTPKSELIVGML